MNSPSCLTGSNHKRGKLTELSMNGRTVLDTREEQGNWTMERTDQRENKTAGCMTSHATCTRQLDNGENRLEGKLDSWPMTHAPSKRTSLASDMRHHVFLVQELGGLWIVESLATSGLYSMVF